MMTTPVNTYFLTDTMAKFCFVLFFSVTPYAIVREYI